MRGQSNASCGLGTLIYWLVPLYFHMVGGHVARLGIFLTNIKFLMSESVCVTVVEIHLIWIVVKGKLAPSNRVAPNVFASVRVVEVRFLHKAHPFDAEAWIRLYCSVRNIFAFVLSCRLKLTFHLWVV